jgi:hypothetical protein
MAKRPLWISSNGNKWLILVGCCQQPCMMVEKPFHWLTDRGLPDTAPS